VPKAGRPLIICLCGSLTLSLLPAVLEIPLSSVNLPRTLWPVLGGAFKVLVLPPVWVGRVIGWANLYDFMVLKGISVWAPPSRAAMLWSHLVVAFPFWLAVLLAGYAIASRIRLAVTRSKISRRSR
jgi:hypothetical protein